MIVAVQRAINTIICISMIWPSRWSYTIVFTLMGIYTGYIACFPPLMNGHLWKQDRLNLSSRYITSYWHLLVLCIKVFIFDSEQHDVNLLSTVCIQQPMDWVFYQRHMHHIFRQIIKNIKSLQFLTVLSVILLKYIHFAKEHHAAHIAVHNTWSITISSIIQPSTYVCLCKSNSHKQL